MLFEKAIVFYHKTGNIQKTLLLIFKYLPCQGF